MIEARIVLDSVNPQGSRLTTWLLTYPRFIHSEFMTHRIFSRNSASSRAIPVQKMIQAVRDNPATFEQVGRANKGMQAQEVMSADEATFFNFIWRNEGRQMASFAEEFASEVAKQVINRALEPWAHMTVLATATDHSNFFRLRAHPMAQPEFQVLAYRMLAKYVDSIPAPLDWEEWHLPGFDHCSGDNLPIEEKLWITTALAARASYAAFDEAITPEKAAEIHGRLRDGGHWSPFEHSAQAICDGRPGKFKSYPWSNFDMPGAGGICGWGQYRKLFPVECARGASKDDLAAILAARPEWVTV